MIDNALHGELRHSSLLERVILEVLLIRLADSQPRHDDVFDNALQMGGLKESVMRALQHSAEKPRVLSATNDMSAEQKTQEINL